MFSDLFIFKRQYMYIWTGFLEAFASDKNFTNLESNVFNLVNTYLSAVTNMS